MKKFLVGFILILSVGSTMRMAQAQETTKLNIQRPKNPVMRVSIGLLSMPAKITADNAYIVETAAHDILMIREAEEIIEITLTEKEKYKITFGPENVLSDVAVRVTPMRLDDLVTVTNFENRPAWNMDLNDNFFFGSVEIVRSPISGDAVLVNELPIERYIKGIAEASDNQPFEYIKALLTAARTYAYWNILHPTKHAGEPFILDASDNDQVYRGAGLSQRSPNVVKAQRATKKRILIYEGEPIIAPYFSQSDGRTRAWDEVWSGSFPWSVSVDDPCCRGETLRGHGVGMSGEGARYFAKQGWDWKTILQYYYKDVVIQRGY